MYAAKMVSQNRSGSKAQVITKFNGKSVTRHVLRVAGNVYEGLTPDELAAKRRIVAEVQMAAATLNIDTVKAAIALANEDLETAHEEDRSVVKGAIEVLETRLAEVTAAEQSRIESAQKTIEENPAVVRYQISAN